MFFSLQERAKFEMAISLYELRTLKMPANYCWTKMGTIDFNKALAKKPLRTRTSQIDLYLHLLWRLKEKAHKFSIVRNIALQSTFNPISNGLSYFLISKELNNRSQYGWSPFSSTKRQVFTHYIFLGESIKNICTKHKYVYYCHESFATIADVTRAWIHWSRP